jgi:ABC-2 type transport system permease protein
MLWHKAWLESRARFLLGVASVATASGYAWYRHQFVYQGLARTTFIMFCFVLAMGGLLRERAVGTAPFTLALPFGRVRHVVTRAAVGGLQVAALAAVPALLVTLLPSAVGHPYPPRQALHFTAFWLAGGWTLFAVAFLASCLLPGEYTPFVVSWTLFFAHTVTTQLARLTHPALEGWVFTLQEIMSGFRVPYIDARTHALVGPFPAAIVATLGAIGVSLIAAAALSIARRDF